MTMKEAIKAQSLGLCPGCGAKIAASLEPAAVMHEVPQCKDFEMRDPIAYAAWVNEKRRNVS